MNRLTKKIFVIFAVIMFSWVACEKSLAKAKVWHGTITIPTYPWQEDINPKFWAIEGAAAGAETLKGAIIYPYTMQDHLSREKSDKIYKAVFLENEYLKITCLPELGGRLHSVFDKTTDREMFHLNSVIKPGMIALRGAWISGGVEWNFGPQGHTVTIVSPVDVAAGTNRDGSAYLEISNIEKIFRTHWTVRVTLREGKAYLDEEIRIFNPIDTMSPYYFWNCTAFPNRKGTRFIYPMTLGVDHSGEKFFSWPINDNKDISWLKNYDTWASIFAYKCPFDFFGAYDVDADQGIVQTADHHEVSGKKAWTWGQWDFGLVSQKSLSDDDEAYIEVQSGPLPTQSDYGMLWPRQELSWQEWWYPVHGLGDGFAFATKNVAVQTADKDGQLELRIIATGKYNDALCTVSHKGNELFSKRLDLSPLSAKVLTVPSAGQSPLNITIKAKDGEVLASFLNPLPIPKRSIPAPDVEKPDAKITAEQSYLKGLKLDRAIDRTGARKYYKLALRKDPHHLNARRELAVLDFEAGLYNRAIRRLRTALQQKPDDDGLAWYFLGSSYLRLGRKNQALDCAYRAARCFGTTAIGYDLAGRVFMRMRKYEKALNAFQKSLAANPADTRTKQHLLLAQYAAGQKNKAYKQAKDRIAENPTDLVSNALLALENDKKTQQFARKFVDFVGEDSFEMTEVSLVFAELGLFDEAERLLAAVCLNAIAQQERNSLALYYLAYFAAQKGDEAAARTYLGRTGSFYKDGVFPSRPEAIKILKYAVKENPADACAHLHLGNVYAHLGRIDEALVQWTKAAELDKSLSVAFRNLGLHSWAQKEFSEAGRFYIKAINARPDDQTLYRDLALILIENQRPAEAIELLESMPFEGKKRSDITMTLAQTYLDEHRYTEAINLLSSTPYFVNWEGQKTTWLIFNQAHIQRGKNLFSDGNFEVALKDFETALTYPENLGVGRWDEPDESPAWYWKGKALKQLGRPQQAKSAWNSGAQSHKGSQEQEKYRQLCSTALLTAG